MIIKTNKELCQCFDASLLKNAREEKPEQHIDKKSLVVYDAMDRVAKIDVLIVSHF